MTAVDRPPRPQQPPDPGEPRALRVTPALLPAAAQRLVEASGRAGPEAADQFVASARSHGIDLRSLWIALPADLSDDAAADAVREGRNPVTAAVLAVANPGRTLMLFPSRPAGPRAERHLSAALAAAADAQGAGIAQALLDPAQQAEARAFDNAGFTRIASLKYLRRKLPAARELPPPPPWPPGVEVTNTAPDDDDRITAALERTYVGTLDCPELCGLRDPGDILHSHRAIGAWDPRLWWLVTLHAEPHGAALFNPCPDTSSVELVYMGLSPALRGKGLGRSLLRHGLAALAGRREKWVTCAVDARNEPAVRVYAEAGFNPFDERLAYVRPLG